MEGLHLCINTGNHAYELARNVLSYLVQTNGKLRPHTPRECPRDVDSTCRWFNPARMLVHAMLCCNTRLVMGVHQKMSNDGDSCNPLITLQGSPTVT
jgi:hypothetical protein